MRVPWCLVKTIPLWCASQIRFCVGIDTLGISILQALASFIGIFKSVKEGNGTLLDNTLIFAHAETSYAKVNAVDNIPVMTIGRAAGRLKTGKHIAGHGDPVSRVGLTAMQVMGLPIETWGTGSLQTSKTISEVLV